MTLFESSNKLQVLWETLFGWISPVGDPETLSGHITVDCTHPFPGTHRGSSTDTVIIDVYGPT